nr:flavodoxin [uncultured Blautia sp.]
MSDTLIAYFSRADENYFGGAIRYVKKGNTEIVCEKIKELMDADTFRIEMKNPYSPVYLNCIEEAKKDLMENARPKLVSMPESIAKYDNIILAYPNYWGTIPMAVATFLDVYDFSGKTIFPLCTNEGSGMGKSESDIKKYAPHAILKSGLAVIGSQAENSQKAIEAWLGNNGLK